MELSDELILSYYRPVAAIHREHGVELVQHTETGKFFVKKRLTVYNREIFEYLRDHPVSGTPRIYAVVEDEGILTVIEEYLSGDSLQEILEVRGTFPEEKVVEMAFQLMEIVGRLHHGSPPILHRDIKPSNLILSPDGRLKLLDFNAAKYASECQSRDTVLMGTAGFAAPEQYGFAASGVQTDIYALGVLFNVLLTGKLPTEQAAEGKLSFIIRRCTELNPRDRFSDIDELTASLHEICPDSGKTDTGIVGAGNWRRFLPPGFRSGSLLSRVTSACGYAFAFYVSASLQVETTSKAVLYLNRAGFLIMILLMIFFTGNYRGIQSILPISRSKNIWIRIAGILIYDVGIALVVIFWIVMLEGIL